jgi:hypothetical protein
LSGQIRVVGRQGLWCPLRRIYFPQLFEFVGARSNDANVPISWLYTLNGDVAPRVKGTIVTPINRIDPDGPNGRRERSLVLRHHETLDRALSYLTGIEDFTNTCDLSEVFTCTAGYFTLLLKPTKPEWPGPLIFYVAEKRNDDDIQRFEVAVGPDGESRSTDLLGTD